MSWRVWRWLSASHEPVRRAAPGWVAVTAALPVLLILGALSTSLGAAPEPLPVLDESVSVGRDFHIGHKGWNGLSDFATLAGDLGCPVEVRRTLDFSALDGQDVLLFLHPETAIDENNLLAFLSAGGRVVLADDYGLSAGVLGRLGITRRVGKFPPGTARYRDGQDLPIAVPVRATPLGRAAMELVANHSAFFTSALPASYAFAAGAALVIEATLQRGRIVAIADPSLFINNMLQLPGNRDFAARLILDVCRQQRDHLVLFYGTFLQRGATPAMLNGAPSVNGVADLPEQWNRALSGANLHIQQTLKRKSAIGEMDVVIVIGLVFSVAALLLLVRYLPMPTPPQDGGFAQPPRPPDNGLLASIQRYSTSAGPTVSWGYIYPATLIREEVLARLGPALATARTPHGELARPEDLTPQSVHQVVAAHFGPGAAKHAQTLWREFRVLQAARPRKNGRDLPARVSEGRLQRFYALATALFAELDKKAS